MKVTENYLWKIYYMIIITNVTTAGISGVMSDKFHVVEICTRILFRVNFIINYFWFILFILTIWIKVIEGE